MSDAVQVSGSEYGTLAGHPAFAARPLGPCERMVDVFDRAATLNFTVVAHVSGALDELRLTAALRALERRHPLLTARIERSGKAARFLPGEAAPIPLRRAEGDADQWRELAEATLAHRVWADEGPRAELTWLRHGPEQSTLLLCLHHVVSDGSSGILAMRDLLRFAGGDRSHDPVPSPGQHAFYPPGHGGIAWSARAAAMLVKSLSAGKPRRFRARGAEEPRRVRIHGLFFDRNVTESLVRRARADGATVHGVLSAALARGIAVSASDKDVLQRILHPVDLRRYNAAYQPALPTPGDAVGYYVSSVETDHRVNAAEDLGVLARHITQSVRAKKAEREPLLTAPIAGPWLTRWIHAPGDLPKFRDTAERQVFTDTFSLTNLGPLESLGAAARYGDLELRSLFFTAAGSVMTPLGGAVTTFQGRLSMTLSWVEPAVSRELASDLVGSVQAAISDYARA